MNDKSKKWLKRILWLNIIPAIWFSSWVVWTSTPEKTHVMRSRLIGYAVSLPLGYIVLLLMAFLPALLIGVLVNANNGKSHWNTTIGATYVMWFIVAAGTIISAIQVIGL